MIKEAFVFTIGASIAILGMGVTFFLLVGLAYVVLGKILK